MTSLELKLERAIEELEIGHGKISESHYAILLREVAARLRKLENGIDKMCSALETNPVTGDRTVWAILETLRQRKPGGD